MNATLRTNGAVAALAVLLGALNTANAGDGSTTNRPSAEEIAKMMAEAAAPGPEHARLVPLAGSWTYTCTVWMDPTQPPIHTTGTIQRNLILGGRFLEERVAGTGFDGKPGFEAFGLIGYDKVQKKYTSTWACSMGTSTSKGLGVSESPTAITFQTESYCPMSDKVVKGREELRIESADKTVATSYVIEDGKETKVVEIVTVRRK